MALPFSLKLVRWQLHRRNSGIIGQTQVQVNPERRRLVGDWTSQSQNLGVSRTPRQRRIRVSPLLYYKLAWMYRCDRCYAVVNDFSTIIFTVNHRTSKTALYVTCVPLFLWHWLIGTATFTAVFKDWVGLLPNKIRQFYRRKDIG